MATNVDEFPIRTRESKYPWAEWLNGSIWRLVRGEDFDADPRVFRTQVFASAKKQGHKIKTAIKEEGGKQVFYLQAIARLSLGENGTKGVSKKKATPSSKSKPKVAA